MQRQHALLRARPRHQRVRAQDKTSRVMLPQLVALYLGLAFAIRVLMLHLTILIYKSGYFIRTVRHLL